MNRHRLNLILFVGTLFLPAVAAAQTDDLFQEKFEELPPAAQPVVPDAEILTGTASKLETEVVRERFDNRRVKIEREVVQDADQNYINHGKWKEWDAAGNVLVEGRHKHNQKDGVWTRLYHSRETKLLNIAPFNRGQLPIISQANFKDGELHGKWVIFDSLKRKLCEWEFVHGRRHGKSTWWYVTGAKMREISYDKGTIHGELKEWDRNGQAVANDKYVDGRRLSTKQESYHNQEKKAEGTVLYPKLVLDKPDDWETCELASYTQEGEPVKHGVWTSWYPNGQRKMEGKYDNDVPAGKFTWWHKNGQKSLEASYRKGKKQGDWTWWHANGLKSIRGHYQSDTPAGDWLWWNDSGKVAQRADFDDPNQRRILAMPSKTDLPETLHSASPADRSVLRKTNAEIENDRATRRNAPPASLRR